MCRTCVGFYSSIGGRRYENNDIFLKLRAFRLVLLLRCAQAMGWSMGP